MCRSGGDPSSACSWSRLGKRGGGGPPPWLAALVLVLAAVCAAPGAAQEPPEEREGLELSPPVRGRLATIQEQWLDWLGAFYRGEAERASEAVAGMLANAREIGMESLPELAAAAAARAVEFAREGELGPARLGLEAADRLDPGRPDTAFAAATVARLEGRHVAALGLSARGFLSLLGRPLLRRLWLENLAFWLAASVLLAAAGFIGLQMATRGVDLLGDLFGLFRRSLPTPLALALGVGLLVWPVFLPSGPLWLAGYWAVLLWGYGSLRERSILALSLLLVGVVPLWLRHQQESRATVLSLPVRALADAEAGRLRGSLFNDLAVVHSVLPDGVAANHVEADLQLLAGAWAKARALYLEVLQEEPDNVAALVDAGACAYYLGDLERAIDYFLRANAAPSADAAGFFNLSRIYSELFRFGESEAALRQARALDPVRVARWNQGEEAQRMVSLRGGLRRGAALERELATRWLAASGEETRPPSPVGDPALILVIGLIAVAVVLQLLTRRVRSETSLPSEWWSGGADLARRILLPGFSEAEEDEWLRAFLVLVLLAAILTLPQAGRSGFALPWIYGPGVGTLRWVAAGGLLVFLVLRVRKALAGGR